MLVSWNEWGWRWDTGARAICDDADQVSHAQGLRVVAGKNKQLLAGWIHAEQQEVGVTAQQRERQFDRQFGQIKDNDVRVEIAETIGAGAEAGRNARDIQPGVGA
jgi:hypothetical protein